MTAPAPLLLSIFPGFVAGGAQRRFCALANRLGDRWRHAIIAIDGRTDCRTLLDPALDLRFIAFPATSLRTPARLRHMRRLLEAERPDVLLTHNWGSIEWAAANRLPTRLAAHLHAEDGFGPEESTTQLRRRVWARRLALARTAIAFPSATLLTLAERVWRLAPTRLHHVPNGIDLTHFSPAANTITEPHHPAWDLRPGGPLIGTVAALRPEKNVARLIRAFAELPSAARLVIIGDGPERAALESLARRLRPPGHIAFAGHVADPASAYRAMDIFALASDTEQMPLSLLEAMATGLPVAATDVGDVARMVAADNRGLVTPRSAAQLGDALAELIDNPHLRRRLGAANRVRAASHYDSRLMLHGWENLLATAR